ncbi:unnamed protein product [Oppiella nova]|uniref:LRAT domain-containing protein n=1 Tax=Oppiella nova TaxID=334625 RepID=A0A7R9LUJ8_9ACAR|nr:unnamed protein product [Oppiella nova]CAG2167104.1 unnamed protein product [Oppiella nova]
METTQSQSGKYEPNVGSFITYDEIRQVIKRGDLIEIWRSLIESLRPGYKHWVICESIDDQGVIWCYHVTSLTKTDLLKVYVKYEPLIDILAKKDRTKGWDVCRINNQEQEAHKTGLIARPLDQVFEELRTLVDQKVEYDFNRRNCEYYCMLWRYGKGWSTQVEVIESKVLEPAAKIGLWVAGVGMLISPYILIGGIAFLTPIMLYEENKSKFLFKPIFERVAYGLGLRPKRPKA